MEKEDFLNVIKPKKGLLIASILFLSSCLGTVLVQYKDAKKTLDNPIKISEATKEKDYVCFDVQFVTESVATATGGEKQQNASIIWNEAEMALISLTKETEKDLKEIKEYSYSDDENAVSPGTKKMCGYTTTIPNQLRNLTVDAYKEIFNSNDLTNTNFKQVFGNYYINTGRTPMDDFQNQAMISGLVSIVGFVMLFIYISRVLSTKNTLKKYALEMESIKSEVAAPDTIHESKARIYLTKNYLIDYSRGLRLYNYKDIVWVYPHELRQNGYVTQRSIYVVTSDSKVHLVANISASKKNNQMFDEIYQEFLNKIPNALFGYTKENREEAKKRYKK